MKLIDRVASGQSALPHRRQNNETRNARPEESPTRREGQGAVRDRRRFKLTLVPLGEGGLCWAGDTPIVFVKH